MVPSWTDSFLDRAGGETADDLAFRERVEEQRRQHREAGVGQHEREVGRVLRRDVVDADRQRCACRGRPSTSKGSRNAFQLVTSVITATVLSTGRESGNMTDQYRRHGPQPSIAAASCNSCGTARKNGRMMMIEIGSTNAACGSATPNGLLSSPVWRSTMNSGRIATATGNSSPSVNSPYTSSRPLNRIAGEHERRQRRGRQHERRSSAGRSACCSRPGARTSSSGGWPCSCRSTHGSGSPTGLVTSCWLVRKPPSHENMSGTSTTAEHDERRPGRAATRLTVRGLTRRRRGCRLGTDR